MTSEERNALIEAMKEVFPTREDFSALRSGLREEMNDRFGEMRAEMNARFDLVPTRVEIDARFDLVPIREEVDARFALVATREELREGLEENRRHFGALAEHLTSIDQSLAEGIENVSQRIDRLERQRDVSRAEELDVLRAGYRDLDRRIMKLERKK